MTIEHKDIVDSERHEPKGVSTASLDEVYKANGSGGGTWGGTIHEASQLGVERLLDGLSSAGSQEPTALDTPKQIEFGGAQFTGAEPVMIDSAGKLTINETGLYRIKVSLAVGRTGGAGSSSIFVRVLVNGTQAGQSIHFKVDTSDQFLPYSDEAWITLPAGTEIVYQVMRDSSGTNSGGLFAGDPTPVDWTSNPCAAIRVERLTNS